MKSRSSLLAVLALALVLFLTALSVKADYVLLKNYDGTSSTFFDDFDFWQDVKNTPEDPTNGYVYYTTHQQAQDWGLIWTAPTGAYIKPDTWTNSTGFGRASVRMQTKAAYNHSLIIADIFHMPTGCGTWPALWMNGPDPWPTGGEIDIIEGVHKATDDKSTLHTTDGCVMNTVSNSSFTGEWDVDGRFGALMNCYSEFYRDPDTNNSLNLGCGIKAKKNNFGEALNNRSGGVYAVEWTQDFIKMWFFWRDEIPMDIQSGDPDPNSWVTPYANFEFGSNCASDHFHDQNIIINLTFCGGWAGGVWSFSECSSLAPTCQEWVQYHPQEFLQAYWQINSIKVYQNQ